MLFWIIAAALAVFVGALLVLAARRGAGAEEPAAAYDLRVYRGQMEEVERDLARGAVNAEDAERLRTEIARKILEADRALKAASKSGGPQGGLGVVLAAVAVAMAGAMALYAWVGAPGYPDMPIGARIADAAKAQETRPGQAEMAAQAAANRPPPPVPDAQYASLMDKLRATVSNRPDDITGQSLLAQNEARLGNFDAAIAAQQKVIALKGAAAGAEDHAALADLMVMATDGYVSPEAEAELNRALALNPADGTSRFYSGLMYAQTGRPDIAFGIWRNLLEKGPQDAPWVPMLRAQIGELAAAAGVDYAPPEAPVAGGPFAGGKGPTEADMANAAAMTPEERQQMIRGMVDQLNDRLATEGGPAEEWAKLIGALGVIGETDRARAIYGEAKGHFANRPEDLATIEAAAAQAGVGGDQGAPAGQPPAMPPTAGGKGPTAADMANAAAMTPEERQQMIRGMVDQLNDRLATEGGPAEEWAKLIGALGVIGETDRARAIYGEAKGHFANRPEDLATIEAAAAQAGVAE